MGEKITNAACPNLIMAERTAEAALALTVATSAASLI